MSGLLLIALMFGYSVLTIWLLIKSKPIWLKPLVLIVAFLIPTADDIYYRHQLDTYCKTQAGYKVYERASKKAGIVDNFVTRAQDFSTSLHLDIVEAYDVRKKLYHFERLPDGLIKQVDIEHLSVPYELVRKEINSGNFIENKVEIIERATGKILGEWTNLNYYGGWWRHGLLGSIADSGRTLVASCSVSNYSYSGENTLIKQVFTKD